VITKITGKLVAVGDDAIGLAVGPMEYEVLVPGFVRTGLLTQVGRELTLCTIEYLEGNPAQGRLIPRLVGFETQTQRQFFDLFCSVDGVGVRKALKALVRPVSEIAQAIHSKDGAVLSSLPGIGDATADRIVAKLRRKVAEFAVGAEDAAPALEPGLAAEAIQLLVSLGHSEAEAKRLLADMIAAGVALDSVEDVVSHVYKHKRPA